MRALLLFVLLAAQGAHAQATGLATSSATASSTVAVTAASTAAATCASGAVKTSELLGQWQVQWSGDAAGEPTDARLVFAANPEFADSLLGLLDLGPKRHELAGDLEEDLLTLEESADGKNISANWSLRAVSGRCGKELAGTWVRASDGKQRPVVLRRAAKW